MSNNEVNQLLSRWSRWRRVPFGVLLFERQLYRKVPYSGSIGARIMELSAGYAKLSLRDRRAVRNHLDCVHAVALVNLGELTSGLAMLTGLQAHVRGIVTGIAIEYSKKARGKLTAECRCDIPDVRSDLDYEVRADIRDAAGELVAVTRVRWRLGPRPEEK